MKYSLSYGGGVNSSALFFYLLEKKMPLDIVIFADTGEETEETYDAVRRMQECCKAAGVEFATVKSPHGRLFDYYREKQRFPTRGRRDCTSKFKVAPIRKFLRERFGKQEKFTTYIGITYDEVDRMQTSNVDYIINSFPFCDDKIDREGNREILAKAGFRAVKSGCIGCMFTTKRDWINLAKYHPERFNRLWEMEKSNKHYPRLLYMSRYPFQMIEQMAQEELYMEKVNADHADSMVAKKDDDDEVFVPCDKVNGGCFL